MSKLDVPLEPLRQRRLSEQVADHIVRHIVENRLSPGDSLPSEVELARFLGVSRPAVREATNTLAGRGLIQIVSGKLPTVHSLAEGPFSVLVNHALVTGQVSMLKVLEVRRPLEEQAVVLAARHRRDEDIEALKALLPKLEASVGDVDAFSRHDMAFHRVIANATGNVLLACILAGIANVSLESSRTGLWQAKNDAEWAEIVELHLKIAEAVIAGDPEAASRHMRAHFASAQGRLERDKQEKTTE
ncbi:FadR/GntR family transcriptional regulator [Mesorhizobium sp. NPDC059054]|uniref:FadR/GntR family transcriptional regulator n=1 Tax=Mesorhizobium sp. NPDC059054 TaxID=3346711 RepID=UPI00367FC353